jgi:hypothetical protein
LIADEVLWAEYAYWMVNKTALLGGTITEYLRKGMREAREKYGGLGSQHAQFFSVLDRQDTWFNDMVRQCDIDKFRHALEEGRPSSKQAESLYGIHCRDFSKAMRRHGTADSQLRNCIVQLVRAACGRPGEVAAFSPDVMIWDPLVEGSFLSWPQMKVHKFKMVGLVAGSNMYQCVFNTLACAMASECFADQVWNNDEFNYFFPGMAGSSSVSTYITNFLKAVVPGSSNVTYKKHQIASFPSDVVASGLRVGAVNEMAVAGIISELIAAVSGHDFEQLSTLFHYLNITRAMVIPGDLLLLTR